MLASSFSFGADWVYIVSGGGHDFYIDKGFYKYDVRTKTADVWTKSMKKKSVKDEHYTDSKSLIRYACSSKNSKVLANINYNEDGSSIKSSSTPNVSFSVIFPDTIDEDIWQASCESKGKGFVFQKYKSGIIDLKELEKKYGPSRTLTPEEVNKLFPNGPHGNQ